VNPLSFAQFLLWTGDVSYVAGLVLMAILSAGAGARIPARTAVPMQFGLTGRPTWSLRRRWALLFAPGLAAGFGLVLTIMAHATDTGDLTQAGVSLALTRAGMALAFVVAHAAHLAIALAWLARRK
jgi:hypothetical protein